MVVVAVDTTHGRMENKCTPVISFGRSLVARTSVVRGAALDPPLGGEGIMLVSVLGPLDDPPLIRIPAPGPGNPYPVPPDQPTLLPRDLHPYLSTMSRPRCLEHTFTTSRLAVQMLCNHKFCFSKYML